MPSITLILTGRSFAQIVNKPQLCTVEFKDLKHPGSEYGKLAAAALHKEFGSTGKYDMLSAEAVDRAIKSLQITSPPDTLVNLFRLAQEAEADTVVTGDIVDYRILKTPEGQQAVVAMNVVVYDVASQLPINGAAISGRSTVRPGTIDEATLVGDAMATGASEAVRIIARHQLPATYILNTGTESALINAGSREGFQIGTEVIIQRGKEQVATAKVSDIEPDTATITIERSFRGIAPGDKVQSIFTPPTIVGITENGQNRIKHNNRPIGANAALISAVLVVGLVAELLSNGNSNNTGVVAGGNAQAELINNLPSNPAVRITWSPDGFAKGNFNRVTWMIYRNDVPGTPVQVTNGDTTFADDDTNAYTITYDNTAPPNGTNCVGSAAQSVTRTPVTPGTPYTYSVQLLFALSVLDLPQGSSSGSTATTAGTTATGTTTTSTATTTTSTATTTTSTATTTGVTTTGTTSTSTTTGTTTTGTTTTGTTTTSTATTTTSTATTTTTTGSSTTTTGSNSASCYFVSGITALPGLATPLNPPTLTNYTSVSGQQNFTFTASATTITAPNSGSSSTTTSTITTTSSEIEVQYALQFSNDPTFHSNVYTWPYTVVSNSTGSVTLSANPYAAAVPSVISQSTTIYWRVGARNIADSPGPIPDAASGQRYVFSSASSFTRPQTPPGVPLKRKSKARRRA